MSSERPGNSSLDWRGDGEARIEEMFKFVNGLQITGGGVTDPVPSIKLSGKRNFKGEATVDREDSLIMRVTAEVVDVKPNGTLVIQARQRIQTDEEVQTFILSGICRAEDVSPDNTILSTQMFDKSLTKTHQGAVRETTRRGCVVSMPTVACGTPARAASSASAWSRVVSSR